MSMADPELPSSKPKPRPSGWSAWLADPRTAVLAFLTAALLFGGGRKMLQGVRARRAVAALGDPNPTPEDVEGVAEHGRAGLIDLFRLLGTAESPEVRDAAGRGLAILWAKDDLIVEEEKALVRRGFAVNWRARRRYPRGLKVPIPIEASYGVPFLVEGGSGVGPSSLEWSHRILGAERAGLEVASPWRRGSGLAQFEVDPSDFPTLGPHRLALASKVRVVGLTDNWEIELPHLPFSFEFDPILTVEAILSSEDDARAAAFGRSIRLEPPEPLESGSRHLGLNAELVLRDPPYLVVTTPLPCDLAHRLAIEVEGVPGLFQAGQVIIGGQDGGSSSRPFEARRFTIGPLAGHPADAIDRPGERRIRAVLTADPELGWADPDVRSLWPGTLTTDWVGVRVIRF
jgi:hypothetical protein